MYCFHSNQRLQLSAPRQFNPLILFVFCFISAFFFYFTSQREDVAMFHMCMHICTACMLTITKTPTICIKYKAIIAFPDCFSRRRCRTPSMHYIHYQHVHYFLLSSSAGLLQQPPYRQAYTTQRQCIYMCCCWPAYSFQRVE